MKSAPLLAAFICLYCASAAFAQFSVRIGRDGGVRSGSYDGYWTPNYTPSNFQARMGTIRFENDTRGRVDVYHVDRYDAWNWVRRLNPGETVGVESPVGDVWAVAGRDGRVMQRVVARPGQQKVEVRYAAEYYAGDRYGSRRAERFAVEIRNRTSQSLTVYSLQPWGEWVWAGAVSPGGGELVVNTYQDQKFQILDRRGRVVRTYQADEDDRRLTLRD